MRFTTRLPIVLTLGFGLAVAAVGTAHAEPMGSVADPAPITVWEGELPGTMPGYILKPVAIPAFQCPVATPWLSNESYSRFGQFPRGVGFTFGGNYVQAQILSEVTYDRNSGRVTGWGSASEFANSMTNWAPAPVQATLTAYCTDDPALAYTAKPTSKPAITSASVAYFTSTQTFTITTSGFPGPRFRIIEGGLLRGQQFRDNGDGTATIDGYVQGSGQFSSILVEVSNGYGSALQRINLYS